MPFSPEVKIEALVACGRCCSICHKFCGIKIECHHVIQEANSGANVLENCIPLCFDCHADMLAYDDKHPKGTKYRPAELKLHRDRWVAKVATARPADYTNAQMAVDQSLFRRILKVLPWTGSISFINYNNFSGFAFSWDRLRDLDEFDAHSGDPTWEFIDPTLEAMRATLAEHVSNLLATLGLNTWPLKHRDDNWSSVPQEWEYEQPERFTTVVREIQASARLCVASYKTFVREGRARLAVDVQFDEPPV